MLRKAVILTCVVHESPWVSENSKKSNNPLFNKTMGYFLANHSAKVSQAKANKLFAVLAAADCDCLEKQSF